MNLSFYVHIPYCVKRCGYCDFNTYTPNELKLTDGISQISKNYAEQVVSEISMAKVAVGKVKVPTIFFGGGTPSLMNPADIEKIISKLKNEFDLSKDCEITLESNPDSLTEKSIAGYKAAGVNRISLGMQSATSNVLTTLDRTHNPAKLPIVTEWIKQAGIEHISVDLIYGTPGETIADWLFTIDTALALPIDHISAYALIVEDGTKLSAQVKRGEISKPDDDEMAEKYKLADDRFTRAGFNWYELSNWAKTGAECQHNLIYWRNENWWGVGPGAHSHISGKRWWNVKNPIAYQERINTGKSPEADAELLRNDQIENENLMLSIRLSDGLTKQKLNNVQINKLESYLDSGYLMKERWNNGYATLSQSGRLIADRILRDILV